MGAAKRNEEELPHPSMVGHWLSTSYRHSLAASRDGLTEAGYLEGENIRIEHRWAEGNVGAAP